MTIRCVERLCKFVYLISELVPPQKAHKVTSIDQSTQVTRRLVHLATQDPILYQGAMLRMNIML